MLVQIALKKDQVLMTEGEPSDVLYLLLSGELGVFKGNQQIASIRPEELVGEMSFLQNQPRSATIKALTDCKIKMMNRPTFEKMFKEQDPMMQKLVLTLAERLRKSNEKK